MLLLWSIWLQMSSPILFSQQEGQQLPTPTLVNQSINPPLASVISTFLDNSNSRSSSYSVRSWSTSKPADTRIKCPENYLHNPWQIIRFPPIKEVQICPQHGLYLAARFHKQPGQPQLTSLDQLQRVPRCKAVAHPKLEPLGRAGWAPPQVMPSLSKFSIIYSIS